MSPSVYKETKTLVKKWKREDRPNLKTHIVGAQESIADHQEQADRLTGPISVCIGFIGDKTKSDAVRKEARKEATDAINIKKMLLVVTDFHKAQLCALSHCYNENIAKAEKYQHKMDVLAKEIDVLNETRKIGVSRNAGLGLANWLSGNTEELKTFMRVAKMVAGVARPMNRQRKTMEATFKVINDMGMTYGY